MRLCVTREMNKPYPLGKPVSELHDPTSMCACMCVYKRERESTKSKDMQEETVQIISIGGIIDGFNSHFILNRNK